MLLYHFTSPENLPRIRRTGLSLGSVHVSPGETLNAVWLTTKSTADAHGLENGGAFLTADQREEARKWGGELPPHGTRFPKDGSIRITVEIHSNDRDLHEWLPWARQHVAPDMMALLHPIGSNLHRAKSWRLFFGTIAPNAFVAIDEVEVAPRMITAPAAV
jgi:hypothetical protein